MTMPPRSRFRFRRLLQFRLRTMLALLLLASFAMAGWHRYLVWLSAWMLPVGYLLAALMPAQKKAGLHIVFIGGFALMALSVGLHVVLAHGGHEREVHGRPWQVPIYGGLLLAAVVLRALMDFDAPRFFLRMTAASACFLAATLLWCGLALPRIWRSAGH